MKKALATVLALGTVAAVAPAVAQPYYGRDYDDRYERYDDRYDRRHYDRYERPVGSYHQSIRNIDQRIDQGYRSGRLSRIEASRLSTELGQFSRVLQLYQRGGLTSREDAELRYRQRHLTARLQTYRTNRGSYDSRYDDRW